MTLYPPNLLKSITMEYHKLQVNMEDKFNNIIISPNSTQILPELNSKITNGTLITDEDIKDYPNNIKNFLKKHTKEGREKHLETLTNLTTKVYETLVNTELTNYEEPITDLYSYLIPSFYPNPQSLINLFKELHRILHITTPIFITTETEQKMLDYSLKDLLVHMKTQNWHNTETHNSGYHTESLLTHSILCMFLTHAYNTHSNNNPIHLLLTSLFHDVGKMGTQQILNNGHVAFPYHGEAGSGILLKLYNTKYGISQTDYYNICRTISCHMCGYHNLTANDDFTTYKWNMFQLENPQVKSLLTSLSIGDNLGRTGLYDTDNQEFINSRTDFYNHISKQFNPQSMLNTYNTCMIVLRGLSGSGKSYTATQLKQHLTKLNIKYTYISRDEHMLSVVGSHLKIEPKEENYSTIYNYYQENKSFLCDKINNRMKQLIDTSIIQNKIIILDTVMSLFPAFKSLITDNFNNCFVISIDVIRNSLYSTTQTRHGLSLNEQIKLGGVKTPIQWSYFHKNLSSYSTMLKEKEIDNNPRLTYQMTHTLGLDEILNLIHPIITFKYPKADLSLEIVDYLNSLSKTLTQKQIKEKLNSNNYLYNNKNNIVSMSYMDFNRQWNPKWTRQARGMIFYLDKENNYIPLKYQLQKGAELLTSKHVKSNIVQTNDIVDMDTPMPFDENQKYILDCLINKKPLTSYLSSKVDGALLGINIYKNPLLSKIIEEAVNSSHHKFTINFMNLCKKHIGYVGTLSTQKTLFTTEQILISYHVNAIVGDIESPTTEFEELEKSPFITKINELLNSNKDTFNTDVITLNFEAVCKDRTSVFNKTYTHSYLAINYTRSFISFLGASTISLPSSLNYHPHFTLTNNIFEEPNYWSITHSNEIETIMDNLTKVIRGTITYDNFLSLHKPKNNITKEMHFEGFVLFTPFEQDNKKIFYDYNKLKTIEYYNSHKYNPSKFDYLLELSKSPYAHHFPICSLISNNVSKVKEHMKEITLYMKDIVEKIIDNTLDNTDVKHLLSKQTEKINLYKVITYNSKTYNEHLSQICKKLLSIDINDINLSNIKNYFKKSNYYMDKENIVFPEDNSLNDIVNIILSQNTKN